MKECKDVRGGERAEEKREVQKKNIAIVSYAREEGQCS